MRFTYKFILFFLLLIWCSGIFIEWLVKLDERFLFLVPILKNAYSLVCHQDNSKLILFDNGTTLTCARCTGIYLGLLFTSLIILFNEPIKKIGIKFLLVASLPMLCDVMFYSINIYHYSKLIAFSTGFLLGSVGFLYLYAGLKNLILEL